MDRVNIRLNTLFHEIGSIKSVTTRFYETKKFKNPKASANRKINFQEHKIFNKYGRLIERTEVNSKGKLTLRNTFEYDRNNNLVEIIYRSYQRGREKIERETYQYNNQNNIAEIVEYHLKDIPAVRITYKYNENNCLNEEIVFNTGIIITRKTYERYDTEKNYLRSTEAKPYTTSTYILHLSDMILEYYKENRPDHQSIERIKKATNMSVTYEENGKIRSVTTIFYEDEITNGPEAPATLKVPDYKEQKVYNEFGLLTERTEMTPKGNIIKKQTFEYDQNNNLVEHIWCLYDSSGKEFQSSITSYRYNSINDIAEEIWLDENRNLRGRVSYKYDNDGNLLEVNRYNLESQITDYNIYDSYDNNKNWLKVTIASENTDTIDITEKVIEYY